MERPQNISKLHNHAESARAMMVARLVSIALLVMSSAHLQAAATGRFVRIESNGSTQGLQLAEVQVLDSSGVNVAKGRPAKQSSTYASAVAARAVDGVTNGDYFGGSVTHTQAQTNAWWEVDLGRANPIRQIKIFNRTDCCASRLAGGHIAILDEARQRIWTKTTALAETRATYDIAVNPVANATPTPTSRPTPIPTVVPVATPVPTPIPSPVPTGIPAVTPTGDVSGTSTSSVMARFVRLELPGYRRTLNLAEIEVFSQGRNVALGKAATQSSLHGSATAGRAVDGNTDGEYWHNSVAHTDTRPNAWLEVDLGAELPLERIVIHNRTDCCAERILPATLRLLGDARQVRYVDTTSIASVLNKYSLLIIEANKVQPVPQLGTGGSSSGTSTSTPTTVPAPVASPNLLRNAAFQQSSNSYQPDFWDLHQVAALNVQDLASVFNMDSSVQSPVSGTKVARLVNGSDSFRDVIFAPTRFAPALQPGTYTFSVYLKSDSSFPVVEVTPAWQHDYAAMLQSAVALSTTRSWQRYVATFNVTAGQYANGFHPLMFFPHKGTYYVAAPQLEAGSVATPFQSAAVDDPYAVDELRDLANARTSAEEIATNIRVSTTPNGMRAYFDYDYYTNQDSAKLIVTSERSDTVVANVNCRSSSSGVLRYQADRVIVSGTNTIDVPLTSLPVGNYACGIDDVSTGVSSTLVRTTLRKQAPSTFEVRINQSKRLFEINGQPHFVIGMTGIGHFNIPDEWYFADQAAHGINTILYSREPAANGVYDDRSLNSVLDMAERHNLKVIVGYGAAGDKPADWAQRLDGFIGMVGRYINNPTIIGWWIVDEPGAGWSREDLSQAYGRVKAADPYRVVMDNWSFSAVGREVGQEPLVGTLAATDIYSTDAYPFTTYGLALPGFTDVTMRASRTADRFGKIHHSWLQVYGGMDAWREPNPSELSYMAYLNLVYGNMYSGFYIRPNAEATWERFGSVNSEAKKLVQQVFAASGSVRLLEPQARGNFIYSLYAKGNQRYLAVVFNQKNTERFSMDLAALLGQAPSRVTRLSDEQLVPLAGNTLTDTFGSYEGKTYVISVNN